MARRKHAHHINDDAIRNLQEWQDHQYDPGYRANLGRLGLFSSAGRRRPVGRYIAYAFAAEFALLLMLAFLERMGVQGAWLGIVFLCATAVVVILLIRQLVRGSGRPARRARGRR